MGYNNIIDKTASKLNVSPKLVRQIIDDQFLFLKETMQEGKEFRMPFFGAFKISPRRKEIYETTEGLNKEKLKEYVRLQQDTKKL